MCKEHKRDNTNANVRNKEDHHVNPMDIIRIITEYYEKFSVYKFDNLYEMVYF